MIPGKTWRFRRGIKKLPTLGTPTLCVYLQFVLVMPNEFDENFPEVHRRSMCKPFKDNLMKETLKNVIHGRVSLKIEL